MNQKLKIIFSVIMVVMLFSAGFTSAESKKPVLKIGLIAPLTGAIAFIGEGMRDALLLAKQQHENGKFDYELVFEDDASDPKLSASAANKLTSIDKVDALITLDGPAGNVVNPIATQKKVIHFGVAVDPRVAKGKYNFIHWMPTGISTKLIGQEFKKRGIKSIGVFKSSSHVDWKRYGDLIEKEAKNLGIKVVTVQDFPEGTRDFRTLIAKAKPTNPDIYVIEAVAPELEILVKQIKEAGIKTPLTGIETMEVSEEPGLFEGNWYVSATEPMSFYVDSFKKKYKGNEPVICSGNAYDIFNLIATAAEKLDGSEKPTTAAIAKELHKIKDLHGAMGHLSIDKDGIVQSEAQVKMVKEGKFVPAE
jgi:branched-chain amino acid transport system substrate-binding protein